MKKLTILFVLFFVVQYVSAEKVERILTEASSVQIALSINPDILIHLQNVEYEEQRAKESRALYFPNLDLNFNMVKFNNRVPMVMLTEPSQFQVYLPNAKKELYYSTRFSIWQNIYSGGRIRYTNKLAKININKVKNEGNIIRNNVLTNVKLTFNNCLHYKDLLSYYHSEILKAEQKKIHLTHVELKDLERKSIREQLNYKNEVLNLLNAIGMELNTIVNVSGTLQPKIKNFDLDKCLLLAYQFQSEIKATQQQEIFDGLMLNLISMQRLPNISIGAAYELVGEKEIIIGDENNWYVAININIPIFDGGSAFARVKQGKIKIRESAIKRAKVEDEIRLNVSKLFFEYDFWKKQAINNKLPEKNGQYNDIDIDIVYNLNKSYYNLEFAVGVDLAFY
ncbi:MAG: TolC family protein [Endomicrobium sp.]|jgi:outer membrane protein TolC|nr:TolC family protein [Endomicrobium sp.]